MDRFAHELQFALTAYIANGDRKVYTARIINAADAIGTKEAYARAWYALSIAPTLYMAATGKASQEDDASDYMAYKVQMKGMK